ncbi:hypothetical protein Nizo1839_1793 [Lactiplantibacillus plantarum]|nr:hypothetical protein Nizo1839_1793 [Lactiplantibacillus plantarum]
MEMFNGRYAILGINRHFDDVSDSTMTQSAKNWPDQRMFQLIKIKGS